MLFVSYVRLCTWPKWWDHCDYTKQLSLHFKWGNHNNTINKTAHIARICEAFGFDSSSPAYDK